MRKVYITKALCFPLLCCFTAPQLFLWSCGEPKPATNIFNINILNEGDFSLNLNTYKESDGLNYISITDTNTSQKITSVLEFYVTEKSGDIIYFKEDEDFTVQYFQHDDGSNVQLQNINKDKLHGDLFVSLKIEDKPPITEFNVYVDNEEVSSSVTKIESGTELETTLSLNKATDSMEIDSINYVKIGENTLEKNDYSFDYENRVLSIKNSSLIDNDVHIFVNIVKKVHVVNIKNVGLKGVSVISSIRQIDNHDDLITQLSIIVTSANSSLRFGEITVLIGSKELTKKDYKFTIDWTVPTHATLTINNSLIKDDVDIRVDVITEDVKQYDLYFCDGVTTIQSPFVADDVNGYSQEKISTFYKNYLWDGDSNKTIDFLKIEVNNGESKKWLVKHVDFEYNSDTLTIKPTAIDGNLRVFIILKGTSDCIFEKESWDSIFHYLEASRNFELLGVITEKDFFLNLYHPANDSFVGLVNKNPINVDGKDYTFRVIGQEEDTISPTDIYYDPNNPRAFLTLQVAQAFRGGIGSGYIADAYRNTEKEILWTNDNSVKKDLDKINYIFPYPLRLIRQVKKQRYISTFDKTDENIEMFFVPSWSEWGAGKVWDDEIILTADGMGSSYSYFTGDDIAVAKKRFDIVPYTNDRMPMTSPLSKNRKDYFAAMCGRERSGLKTAEGASVSKYSEAHTVLPWCFCI